MLRRGLRQSNGRALAGAVLAGPLILAPGPLGAQESAQVPDPAAVVDAGSRPAVTVLDLEAQVRTGPGPSLTLRMMSLHHLPGKELPLRFRGRELRLAVGMRIPLE